MYNTRKNINKLYNNKFKMSAPTWNDKFELPDGSYSIPNIRDYFEYILNKYGEKLDNPSIRIHVNRVENRSTVKVLSFYQKH